MIVREPNGTYAPKFAIGGNLGPELQRDSARFVGAQILCEGTCSPKKVKIIEEAVKRANKEGSLDAELLKTQLSE